MIRGIFILAIVGYLIYRFGKALFKFFYLISGEEGDQSARTTFGGKRKPVDGNVNIDKVPNNRDDKKKFKGGDYVDYEEI